MTLAVSTSALVRFAVPVRPRPVSSSSSRCSNGAAPSRAGLVELASISNARNYAISFHEPQRRQPVEPGVGDALDEPLSVTFLKLAQYRHLRCVGGQKIWRPGGEDIIQLPRDRFHELAADGRSEGFEGGGVQGEL